MNKLKLFAILACSIVMANPLFAQEELTLQEAISFALKNKADAKKSALDIENAEYKIDEVRSGALPQVSIDGSFNYNPLIPQVSLGGQSFKMGTTWGTNVAASVSQQLFNQSLFTGLKAAKSTREFYIINNTLTEELLIEKVANSYYEVFQTQLQLKTIQSNLDNTKKTRNVIEGLVKAGLGKKIDLDRTTVAINNLESQKQQVINTLEIQENALKFAIGMNMDVDIKLPSETFNVSATSLVDSVNLNNRTEVLVLNKQSELLQLNKKAIIADYYPSLSFSGNLGNQGMGDSFVTSKNYIWSNLSTLGLNLKIPIFNGGATKSKINQAEIEIKRLAVDLEDTKLGLSLASENAKTQMKNSLLVINSNEANVGLAKEVLENTENNYRNGLATLTELLEAENAYADAQNNYTTSLLNYKVAEIQLIKANGNLKSLVNE